MAIKPKTYWAVVDKKGKLVEADIIDRFEECSCHAFTFDGFAIFKTKTAAENYRHDDNEKIAKVKLFL